MRFKRSGKNMKLNAKSKKAKQAADLFEPVDVNASEPTSLTGGGASGDAEKEMKKRKHISGYIFMCSSITKPECYQYRVFGLPKGRKELVQQIRPGMKLFLFDFEAKLLYGVYEATSVGKLNLEPTAFRGKFPAQVKFKISKECLPITESSLKQILKENYAGLKFKQELSRKQVRKLSSSFRPLFASLSQPAPQALTNTSLPQIMNPNTVNLVPPAVPYMQYAHTHPLPRTSVQHPQPGYYTRTAYLGHAHPDVHLQNFPASSTQFIVESQRPYVTERFSEVMQEPHLRCRAIDGRVHQGQQASFPVQREELHKHSAVPYCSYAAPSLSYASSITQPQAPEPRQTEGSRVLNHDPYIPSAVPQALYNSYMGPTVPQASALVHPQVPQSQNSEGTAPVSAYYSYSYAGANRTIH